MLGPFSIARGPAPVPLARSRKVRALIAYLALAPRPVARSKLCELLWDAPNDPRGELRWCLAKVRRAVDEPSRPRLVASDETVRLDLSGCFVDALEITAAIEGGIGHLGRDRLAALAQLFAGEFMEGLEIDRLPEFAQWLTSERRRFRAMHASVLEHLVVHLPAESEALFGHLARWLELFPFERRAHELLLGALATQARLAEGEEHVATTARLFEAEGLDWRPVRDAWRTARARSQAVRSDDVLAPPKPGAAASAAQPARRRSIVVMPFADSARIGIARGGLTDGLVHDIITRLAKLRSLFVIAQGTVFALDERSVGAHEAGRTLDVDYAVGGSVRRIGKRIAVAVELAETRTARVLWADTFDRELDEALLVLDEIGDRIVASLASEIEAAERNRAILKPPSSLDAWEAHHRGLWHMYRFNRADNARAQHYFDLAVRLDPTFARAYAGLSFTHFQNAFQHWAPRGPEVERAFAAAGQGLLADERDPAAHWAMGRALWLRGREHESLDALSRAVDLSPNFALGHYTLAFVHSQSGDPEFALRCSDHSRALSPFDPLMFAMLASRAISLVRLDRFDEAADWAVKAAARPNAHVHIQMIAATSLALADRLDDARAVAGRIRAASSHYRAAEFFDAFRFSDEAATRFRAAARRIGMT